ncbi:hypothetical protein [Streptomyces adustus]
MSGRTDSTPNTERDPDIAETPIETGAETGAESGTEVADEGDRPDGPRDSEDSEDPEGPEDRADAADPEGAADSESPEGSDGPEESDDLDDPDDPDDLEDHAEDARRARWTASVTGVLLTLMGIAAALLRCVGPAPALAPAAYALGAVVCAPAAVLGHRGHTRRALWLLIAGVMVMAVGDQVD